MQTKHWSHTYIAHHKWWKLQRKCIAINHSSNTYISVDFTLACNCYDYKSINIFVVLLCKSLTFLMFIPNWSNSAIIISLLATKYMPNSRRQKSYRISSEPSLALCWYMALTTIHIYSPKPLYKLPKVAATSVDAYYNGFLNNTGWHRDSANNGNNSWERRGELALSSKYQAQSIFFQNVMLPHIPK